jgi:hypothetical protein
MFLKVSKLTKVKNKLTYLGFSARALFSSFLIVGWIINASKSKHENAIEAYAEALRLLRISKQR